MFDSFNFYTVPDLTEEERKPPEFLISEMIPEVGLTLLSGKPKTRKSFLAVQIAIAIATGTPFFGCSVKKTNVAYFDLEGSKSRISARTGNMSIEIPREVKFSNSLKMKGEHGKPGKVVNLTDGSLVEMIRTIHRQHPEFGLVIIDTYGRARGDPKSKGQNAYDADVTLLSPLTEMILEEKLAVLLIHHDNKLRFGDDSFDSISGSTGITGCCDSILQLKTIGKRFDGKGELSCVPRDSRGCELSLQFNERCTEWQQITKSESTLMESPICRWILSNRPEPKTTGDFYGYQDLHKLLYGFSADRAGERIKQDLDPFIEDLFRDYHIAVQSGIKYGGDRGIRLLSVM